MADASLDDFFAKKDKTKKKSKSKIKPDDILAQQDQDELAKSKKSKKKKKSKDTEKGTDESKKKVAEDDEWKDFEEDKEVDYTGLRIKEMQLGKDEEEQEEEEGREDEGEGRERKEGGPWNKSSDGPQEPIVVVQERLPTPENKPEPEAKPAVAKYVPPSRRGDGAATGAAVTMPARRKKKEAPNLHSEHDFPTLGGADYTQGGQFEEVKGGNRQTGDPSKQRLNLQLDNKFGALDGEDS